MVDSCDVKKNFLIPVFIRRKIRWIRVSVYFSWILEVKTLFVIFKLLSLRIESKKYFRVAMWSNFYVKVISLPLR